MEWFKIGFFFQKYSGSFCLHRLFRNGYALVSLDGPRSKYLSKLKDISGRIAEAFPELSRWSDPVGDQEIGFVRARDVAIPGPDVPDGIKFVRIVVLEVRGAEVKVFLIDLGCEGLVRSDAGRRGSPSSSVSVDCLTQPPLLSFAEMEGFVSGCDMEMVEACSSLLVNLWGVGKDLGAASADLSLWMRALQREKSPNYRQLAVRVFRSLSEESHRSPTSINNQEFHRNLCLVLCNILFHDRQNEDVIYTLYFTMDRMIERLLVSTYEECDIGNLMKLVKEALEPLWLEKRDLVNAANKICSFKVIFNLYTESADLDVFPLIFSPPDSDERPHSVGEFLHSVSEKQKSRPSWFAQGTARRESCCEPSIARNPLQTATVRFSSRKSFPARERW